MLCPPEFIVMGGGREVSRLWLLFFFFKQQCFIKTRYICERVWRLKLVIPTTAVTYPRMQFSKLNEMK